MARYVLLYHECPAGYERPSHWDLMLEAGDVLRTWALMSLPRDWGAVREHTVLRFPTCAALAVENAVAVEQLGNHRLAYLHLEGPLSGNRGEVRRIDAGTYESIAEDGGALTVAISSGQLAGRISLDAGMLRWQPDRG